MPRRASSSGRDSRARILLAEALVLTAVLAFVHHRPRAGGILTGLAVATRPEIAVVALAAALVSLRSPSARRELAQAAPATAIAAALVFLVLRQPFEVQDWRLVWLSPLLLVAALLVALTPRSLVRFVAVVGVSAIALALFTYAGPLEVWHSDWPLLVLGGVSVTILLRDERGTTVATLALGGVLLLGAVYVLKNPSLERYFSLLVPAAAFLAGTALASLTRSARLPLPRRHRARGAHRVHAPRAWKSQPRCLRDRRAAGRAQAERRCRAASHSCAGRIRLLAPDTRRAANAARSPRRRAPGRSAALLRATPFRGGDGSGARVRRDRVHANERGDRRRPRGPRCRGSHFPRGRYQVKPRSIVSSRQRIRSDKALIPDLLHGEPCRRVEKCAEDLARVVIPYEDRPHGAERDELESLSFTTTSFRFGAVQWEAET